MLAHLLGIATGLVVGLPFLGPLVIYLWKKDESRFVRHHAADVLNLTLTSMIVFIGVGVLGCVLLIVGIGFILLLLLIPYAVMLAVYMIIAAVAANGGEWFSYPTWLRIRMVD